MDTRRVTSGAPSGSVTARIASEFVRTSSPSRAETRGSEPCSRHAASSRFVPSAPAATTTPRAVSTCRSRRSQAPERSLVTA
jgi:hypothetical protein